jgi:hypothetical protein
MRDGRGYPAPRESREADQHDQQAHGCGRLRRNPRRHGPPLREEGRDDVGRWGQEPVRELQCRHQDREQQDEQSRERVDDDSDAAPAGHRVEDEDAGGRRRSG